MSQSEEWTDTSHAGTLIGILSGAVTFATVGLAFWKGKQIAAAVGNYLAEPNSDREGPALQTVRQHPRFAGQAETALNRAGRPEEAHRLAELRTRAAEPGDSNGGLRDTISNVIHDILPTRSHESHDNASRRSHDTRENTSRGDGGDQHRAAQRNGELESEPASATTDAPSSLAIITEDNTVIVGRDTEPQAQGTTSTHGVHGTTGRRSERHPHGTSKEDASDAVSEEGHEPPVRGTTNAKGGGSPKGGHPMQGGHHFSPDRHAAWLHLPRKRRKGKGDVAQGDGGKK